jgi:putative transposase
MFLEYANDMILFYLPKEVRNKKIKLIEIKPLYGGNRFKLFITYEHEIKEIKINDKCIPKIEESISIDLGTVNLMTIYDPSGEQKIIKGSPLTSKNYYYNLIIDHLKSKTKIINNKETSRRIQNLLVERSNVINNYFNKIVKTLEENYSNKKLIIIGYNEGWKTSVNIGHKNNRNFYQIPYANLIKKLEYKMKMKGIDVRIVNEAYTSKCDALSGEEICRHKNYLGERIKRGLFSSGKGKLLNADINGAINIIRKYYKMNNITIKKINGMNLCNPSILQIKK